MGANFNSEFLDGKLSRTQVAAWFRKACSDAAHRCGSEYSGSWNMLNHLTFGPDQPDTDAAYDYCEQNSQKWENAVACRAKRKVTNKAPTFGNDNGRASGLFNNFQHVNPRERQDCVKRRLLAGRGIPGERDWEYVAADQLTERQQERAVRLAKAAIEATGLEAKARRAFSDLIDRTRNLEAKTPKASEVDRAKSRVRTATARAKKAQEAYLAACEQHAKKLYGHRVENVWVIGGWCAE
jgi:hypothetical protein